MSSSSSAAHWCKSIIDEVVPTANNYVTTPKTTPAIVQPINPQYLQYYQDYYKQQGGTGLSSALPAVSASQSVQQVQQHSSEPLSYKAALIQPNQMVNHMQMPVWNNGILFPQHFGAQSIASSVSQSTTANTVQNNGSTNTAVTSAVAADPRPKKVKASRFSTLTENNTSMPAAAKSTSVSTTVMPSEPKPTPPVKQSHTLNDFVKRSFAACTNDADRAFVNTQLQQLISRVTADGRVAVHRWDLEPCPCPPSAAKPAVANKLLSVDTDISSNNGEGSKKRKSRWGGNDEHQHPMPPSPAVQHVSLTLPSSPAKKKSALSGVDAAPTKEELQRRQSRANRFENDQKLNPYQDNSGMTARAEPGTNKNTANGGKKNKKNNRNVSLGSSDSGVAAVEFDMESLKIVGTCQKLEKDYLRLTSAPHPSVVRPEAVLRKSIQLLKKKWAAEEVNYVYMCSQLKSLRQDLTVQHIKNDFTVHVYETHARVALESDDMNEYNQCQTQLKQLYASGLKGSEMEFTAYLILYYVYLLGNKKYKGGSSDLAFVLAALKPEAYSNEAVQHALKVRQAVQVDNYQQFFRLYRRTPNMGNYLLDLMLDSFRLQALQKMCRAYKPSVPAAFVLQQLGFEEEDRSAGMDLLTKAGCQFNTPPAGGAEELELNTKDTVVDMAVFQTQDKLLL